MTDKKNKPDNLGLEGIGDLSGLLNTESSKPLAGPLNLDIDLIDEDPNQPRTESNPGFTHASLLELSETIAERGVKSPISVRESTVSPGRYMINHGARRFRASVLAGKETIPAFIDPDYNEADQVIENLQRNELTAREIADFIGRMLADNMKKGEIATLIGKSPAFVTQHAALLDLPDPVGEVFNNGRVKDVTVINELVTAYKQSPEEVENWLADENQELTRGSVKMFRDFLDDKESEEDLRDPNTVDAFSGQTDAEQEPEEEQVSTKKKKEQKEHDPDKFAKAIVQVEHDGRIGRIILNRRPPHEGWAWIKYDDDGYEFESDLGDVKLIALIEG